MLVRDLMRTDAPIANPDLPVQRLASRMKRCKVAFLPVIEDHAVVGYVTDRDVIGRSVAKGRDPLSARVHEIMCRGVFTVFDDESHEAAADCMCVNHVDCLLVLDRVGQFVGTISLVDLATRSQDYALVGRTLSAVHRSSRRCLT
jgi:CBS domain-containing protein